MATLIAHIKPRDWACPRCAATVRWYEENCYACRSSRPLGWRALPTVEASLPVSRYLRVNDIQRVNQTGVELGEQERANYSLWSIDGKDEDWAFLADAIYGEVIDAEDGPVQRKLAKRRYFIDQASALAPAEDLVRREILPRLCERKRAVVATDAAKRATLDGEIRERWLGPIPLDLRHVYDRVTKKALA